ncbi:head GIN domain-containing protein [Pontibacter harenae]|uniref:head GIN domain-containing protein n=1 Tax=Pontibacter harenae TaxID=2894083 RepID=UPI001E41518E|nr:head GIN domain-containing protein [Pontibacter harenae]MCC9165344.1 DUF2807 domain-containing protein [Pontibacter harenae]
MKVMKSLTSSLVLSLMALLFLGVPAFAQTLKGNGNLKSQTRKVSGISGIDVSGGFQVELTLGNNESVRLEAEENLLSNIKTVVRNGVLHIYNDKSISSSKSMKAYITLRDLTSIDISGGVKVVGKSVFKPSKLTLDMSGGTSVKLAVETSSINADMSGASKIELTGRTNTLVMDMSGASNVNAEGLQAKRVSVEASGASKIRVHATESLDIDASGASNIAYKGNPRVTSDTSGGTKISKI